MSAAPDSPAGQLLAWFDRHKRDLPWRHDRDPYRVWLSEVMLQQTRVETVLPYFERLMRRFPTVGELARAPLDEVLALWTGLGYYRRARQLHAAARQIAARGEFPSTVPGWQELPGIGAYTAAAVASIASGVVVPLLDGNVERVMCRRLALDEDPKRKGTRARLLAAAAELLDPERPGDSNQALMEIGATLCLPRRASCELCPLLPGCAAARQGQPERYSPSRRKRPIERRRLLVAVVARDDRVLLYRRPPHSELLADTWELPWLELPPIEPPPPPAPPAALAPPAELAPPAPPAPLAELAPINAAGGPSLACLLAEKYGGGEWRLGSALAEVRHGITYRDLAVTVCRADIGSGPAGEVRERLESGWFDAGQRAALPMSSLVDKVLRAAAAADLGVGGAKGARRAGAVSNRGRRANPWQSRRRG